MDAHDYPIHHYQEMSALAAAFKTLPAQVLEHMYSYEAFGSWSTLLRYKGVRMQLAFDGKDYKLTLRRSKSQTRPDQWGKILWMKSHRDAAMPVSEVIGAVGAAAADALSG